MKISRSNLRKIILEHMLNETEKYPGLDTRQADMSGILDMLKSDQAEEDKEVIDKFANDLETGNADMGDIEDLRHDLEVKITKSEVDQSNLVTKDDLKAALSDLKAETDHDDDLLRKTLYRIVYGKESKE